MPHGTPDWGLVGPKDTTYGLDDLGEAVVRLGSPIIWDRRGDVVWMETWDRGLRNATVAAVALASNYALNPTYAENGPYALWMTAGGSANDTIRVYWQHPVFAYALWGLEVWFSVNTNVDWIQFTLAYFDGTQQHTGRVTFDPSARTLTLTTTMGAGLVLDGNYPVYVDLRTHHVLKFVADFQNNRYTRLILDNYTVDISGIPLFVFGIGTDPCSVVEVQTLNRLDFMSQATVDTVIITQNEPIG